MIPKMTGYQGFILALMVVDILSAAFDKNFFAALGWSLGFLCYAYPRSVEE